LIGSHQLHCHARKYLLSTVPTLVQHYAAESKVLIDRREIVRLRPIRSGVFHTERIEDALAHERAEGLSGHARDQGPKHIAAHVVSRFIGAGSPNAKVLRAST
jgi:hypothetical protein